MRSYRINLIVATGLVAFAIQAAVAPAASLNLNVDFLGGHIPPAAPPNGNVSGLFTGAGPGGGGTWNALTVLDHGGGAGENGTYNNQTVFDPSNAGSDNPSFIAAAGPFVYSNGATASGISITLANFVSSDDQTPGQPGPYGGGNGNVMLDSYLVQTNPASVTISGLTSGGLYNVFVFGSNGGQGVGGQFTVGGNTASTTGALPASHWLAVRARAGLSGIHRRGGHRRQPGHQRCRHSWHQRRRDQWFSARKRAGTGLDRAFGFSDDRPGIVRSSAGAQGRLRPGAERMPPSSAARGRMTVERGRVSAFTRVAGCRLLNTARACPDARETLSGRFGVHQLAIRRFGGELVHHGVLAPVQDSQDQRPL